MNKEIILLLSIVFLSSSCQRTVLRSADFTNTTPQAVENDSSNELPGIVNGKPLESGHEISSRLVALMVSQENKSSLCTGALFPGNIILTAAHCVHNSEITLVFHTDVHSLNSDNASALTRPVVRMIVHPGYANAEKSVSSNFDLAMIKFLGRAPEGTQIFNLPLTPVPLDGTETLLVAGYGTTDPAVNTGGILRFTTQSAGSIHRTENDTASFHVDQIDSGVCSGDSGGPLFLQKDGKLQLIGVASKVVNRTTDKSKKCNDQAIYTDISQHLEWIKKTYIELRKD